MKTKDVLVLLTDEWSDWEASYALAEINSTLYYTVKTVAADKRPKTSIGGIRAEIDLCLSDDIDAQKIAMLILPGGFFWQKGRHDEIAAFIKKIAAQGIPIAAICGATIFLGKHGLLNRVRHTGDTFESFKREAGYLGDEFYVPVQVVVDNGFITANETAALEFAHEIFKLLKIDDASEIDKWYDYFKNGMTEF